jgi:hypothetical protein
MKRPLALSDHQMSLVRRAAAAQPVNARDGFLQDVARRLADEPSDAAVSAAIDAELALNRLPTFLCDSTQQEKIK